MGSDSPQTPQPSAMQLLRYGQRITFPAPLITPRNYRNPGAFDYAGYLREKGIVATASTKYAAVQLLPGFAGSRVMLGLARVHRSVIGKVHSLWPERVAGLMDAIVIGEESFIDRPARVDFQRSGTYHVLVVSGMNVSILAMFTLWILRRVGLGEVAASACAILLILAYAVLTNVGPPVLRAALMFAVYLATRLLHRDRAMLNALGAAALALLIVEPEALFGASFQMTFLCVGLVAGVGIPLLERTIEPYSRGLRNLDALAYDRSLPPRVTQFRLDLRLLLNRLRALLPGRFPRWLFLFGLRGSFGFCETLSFLSCRMVASCWWMPGGLPFWMHSQLDIGEDVVSPYLWARGISRLDAIALTHAHADHMGGMAAVIANFRPRELWLPEGIPEKEIQTLLKEANQYGVSVRYRKAGDAFSYGGAEFRVLAPDPARPVRSASKSKDSARRNDESLVMKISFGKTSALLEADAEKGTERFVSTELPAADVLKVAHHGSASSTNDDFLAAVKPRFAVISVGARNVYHHPRREVLERLQQAKALTYRTDMDGATSFYLDGKTVTSHLADLH
jgi:ComEC/Rec2-related protein